MAPAVFDIGATGLCCIGFLYIPASVWRLDKCQHSLDSPRQLLRGAEIVFVGGPAHARERLGALQGGSLLGLLRLGQGYWRVQ